ncbi:MAG: GIY-YIG nuclease family protein, partial [Rhabdochlamydiaceae bacterium]
VYIVRCSDGTYYTGKTNNVDIRMKQHNGLLSGGAKYTAGRRPVTLIYLEKFTNQTTALQREWEMKQLTKEQKEKLIYEESGTKL